MIVLDAQMCSVNINELRDILKIRLSKKRYTHSLNVADAALKLAEKYGVSYLFSDFKKKNGYKRSTELSKIYGIYRQNYCGCVFSMRETEERNKCREQ